MTKYLLPLMLALGAASPLIANAPKETTIEGQKDVFVTSKAYKDGNSWVDDDRSSNTSFRNADYVGLLSREGTFSIYGTLSHGDEDYYSFAVNGFSNISINMRAVENDTMSYKDIQNVNDAYISLYKAMPSGIRLISNACLINGKTDFDLYPNDITSGDYFLSVRTSSYYSKFSYAINITTEATEGERFKNISDATEAGYKAAIFETGYRPFGVGSFIVRNNHALLRTATSEHQINIKNSFYDMDSSFFSSKIRGNSQNLVSSFVIWDIDALKISKYVLDNIETTLPASKKAYNNDKDALCLTISNDIVDIYAREGAKKLGISAFSLSVTLADYFCSTILGTYGNDYTGRDYSTILNYDKVMETIKRTKRKLELFLDSDKTVFELDINTTVYHKSNFFVNEANLCFYIDDNDTNYYYRKDTFSPSGHGLNGVPQTQGHWTFLGNGTFQKELVDALNLNFERKATIDNTKTVVLNSGDFATYGCAYNNNEKSVNIQITDVSGNALTVKTNRLRTGYIDASGTKYLTLSAFTEKVASSEEAFLQIDFGKPFVDVEFDIANWDGYENFANGSKIAIYLTKGNSELLYQLYDYNSSVIGTTKENTKVLDIVNTKDKATGIKVKVIGKKSGKVSGNKGRVVLDSIIASFAK